MHNFSKWLRMGCGAFIVIFLVVFIIYAAAQALM